MIKLFRINTGSCGACDAEIEAVVRANRDLAWAGSPAEADVLLLTGVVTASSKAALLPMLRELTATPLLAVGRCAIDGYPFGRGGLAEHAEIVASAMVDGCPPKPATLLAAVREHAKR